MAPVRTENEVVWWVMAGSDFGSTDESRTAATCENVTKVRGEDGRCVVRVELDAFNFARLVVLMSSFSRWDTQSVDEGDSIGTILPHSDFGDPQCCGCLYGVVHGHTARIVCNECGVVVRKVSASELQRTFDEMELTLDLVSAKCPHCGSVNLFPGFTEVVAYVCRDCGKAVPALAKQRRNCETSSVRCCVVQMQGKDKIHTLTLEASSVFDAANQAMEKWSLLWWFDPEAVIKVQCCEERWSVSQERVRRWRGGQHRTGQDRR